MLKTWRQLTSRIFDLLWVNAYILPLALQRTPWKIPGEFYDYGADLWSFCYLFPLSYPPFFLNKNNNKKWGSWILDTVTGILNKKPKIHSLTFFLFLVFSFCFFFFLFISSFNRVLLNCRFCGFWNLTCHPEVLDMKNFFALWFPFP